MVESRGRKKAITKTQVAVALGFQQRLFDERFALARMRHERRTLLGQLFPDQQRVVTEATGAYLAELAEQVRSPGYQPALRVRLSGSTSYNSSRRAAPAASSSMTPEQRMQQLDKLAAGGYITPAEYKAKKKAILDSL